MNPVTKLISALTLSLAMSSSFVTQTYSTPLKKNHLPDPRYTPDFPVVVWVNDAVPQEAAIEECKLKLEDSAQKIKKAGHIVEKLVPCSSGKSPIPGTCKYSSKLKANECDYRKFVRGTVKSRKD